MAIKHILAPVGGDRDAAHVALCALKLAEALKAHVTATNVPLSTTTSLIPEAAISPGVYAELQKAVNDSNAQRTARARRFFDNAVALTKTPIVDTPICARASTAWVDLAMLDDSRVATMAQMTDLLVIDKPGDAKGSAEMEAFEAGVFGARRPVLVLPQDTREITCENVAVAWNGSREAAEAVKYAMDLLAPGAKVTVIQVGEIRGAHMTSDSLLDYLGWHCHTPVLRKVADKQKATTEILLAEAKAAGAQLLIAGAYSHSRTRELFLGGVTRQFLAHADIPLFMAH